MAKKYRMVYEKGAWHPEGKLLYRIYALREGDWGPAGTKGGLVEKAANLDQEGECWLTDDAFAIQNSRVTGNAHLRDVAGAYDNAKVGGNSACAGTARIMGNASLLGYTIVGPNCTIKGDAVVESAIIFGFVYINGPFTITEDIRGTI